MGAFDVNVGKRVFDTCVQTHKANIERNNSTKLITLSPLTHLKQEEISFACTELVMLPFCMVTSLAEVSLGLTHFFKHSQCCVLVSGKVISRTS